MTHKPHFDDEDGLTLIELMISIGILMIIIVPLTTALLLEIVETTSSRERTNDASAAQLISTYLQNDIQSSCLRTEPTEPETSQCGAGTVVKDPGSPVCATATNLAALGISGAVTKLELARNPSFGDKVVVDYVAATVDGQKELHRVSCVGTGAPDDVVLALNLDSSKFDPTCFNAAGDAMDCNGATPPASISIAIKADSAVGEGIAAVGGSYGGFDFTFVGRRRVGA